MSEEAPINNEFIAKWHAFIKNPRRVTNDPMEAHFIGFNMWVEAVKKAGTIDSNAVIDALMRLGVDANWLTTGAGDPFSIVAGPQTQAVTRARQLSRMGGGPPVPPPASPPPLDLDGALLGRLLAALLERANAAGARPSPTAMARAAVAAYRIAVREGPEARQMAEAMVGAGFVAMEPPADAAPPVAFDMEGFGAVLQTMRKAGCWDVP